jgi:transposase
MLMPGLKLLEGYRGIVQCDGYAAYKKIAATPGEAITLAFCWTHLRRRFFVTVRSRPRRCLRGPALAIWRV